MSAYQDFSDFVEFHGCKLFVPEDEREDLPPLSVYEGELTPEPRPPGYGVGRIEQLTINGKPFEEFYGDQLRSLGLKTLRPHPTEEIINTYRERHRLIQDLRAQRDKNDPYGASGLFPPPVDQHTPGAKLDDGKIDMSLLEDFGDALMEVCRVGSYGQVKYSRGGWLKVPNGILRYTAAMLRHFFAEKLGTYDTDPWYDTEKGLPFKGKVRHDAQVAWNALARLQRRLHEEAGRE